jgi:hypothetical protein
LLVIAHGQRQLVVVRLQRPFAGDGHHPARAAWP